MLRPTAPLQQDSQDYSDRCSVTMVVDTWRKEAMPYLRPKAMILPVGTRRCLTLFVNWTASINMRLALV